MDVLRALLRGIWRTLSISSLMKRYLYPLLIKWLVSASDRVLKSSSVEQILLSRKAMLNGVDKLLSTNLIKDKLGISEIIDIFISSHVRISYRFHQFVTTRYTTDFYIIIVIIESLVEQYPTHILHQARKECLLTVCCLFIRRAVISFDRKSTRNAILLLSKWQFI